MLADAQERNIRRGLLGEAMKGLNAREQRIFQEIGRAHV